MWILLLIINLLILFLWARRIKKKGKKIPWYFGFILPTDLFVLVTIALGSLIASIYFISTNFPIKNKNTQKEMELIRDAINDFEKELNRYPISLNELIGNKPVRKDWLNDAWGNEYSYQNLENIGVELLSKGKDGRLNTEDDILIKIRN